MTGATTETGFTSIEQAVEFLRSQGYQVNPVDGIYRVRKEGWKRLPYELDAETLIEQANLLLNKQIAQGLTSSRAQGKE